MKPARRGLGALGRKSYVCYKCKKKIKESFLGKIIGTYVKGKPYCRECQMKMDKK